ncbi:MAG: hypothetical protein LRZ85_09380 [Alphaproteobacteria bacterium]|nr:hypothetical protein [Alphaproteobacteria bacterium]MCD8520425.1 hypothetical protein [Alphaproteobacteria bacterium]
MKRSPSFKPDNDHEPDSPIGRLNYNHWYRRAFMNSAEALGEMSLMDALRLLWSARLWLAGGALLGLAAASLLWFTAVPHYRAALTIAPANPMNGAQFSRLLQNDENLAPLNFILQRVGSGNTPDFIRFEAILRGQTMAEALLENPVILEGLARDRSFVWSAPPSEWTPAQFSEYLAKRVDIASVPGGGLRVVRYSHPDPRFAAYLLSELARAADASIRRKTKTETLGRIAYLQAELSKTNNPDHRRALADLLLEQERLNMLVSIEQAYAADIVETASSSSRPLWPDIPLSALVFVLAGMGLGFAVFGLRRS